MAKKAAEPVRAWGLEVGDSTGGKERAVTEPLTRAEIDEMKKLEAA